ncbi:hypothetical protein BpHYR1_036380 [Brachionus plicatilis]|uniref:Uncharacterized protein n=1 Tax=Brachionus plicatilis TaxID=10195 RepID=A0A3M7SPG2_BRAPC|nr:hypothetical protein BpHYR1_036380 [Brachionus plicatilis]
MEYSEYLTINISRKIKFFTYDKNVLKIRLFEQFFSNFCAKIGTVERYKKKNIFNSELFLDVLRNLRFLRIKNFLGYLGLERIKMDKKGQKDPTGFLVLIKDFLIVCILQKIADYF